jgi:hypothetical protein
MYSMSTLQFAYMFSNVDVDWIALSDSLAYKYSIIQYAVWTQNTGLLLKMKKIPKNTSQVLEDFIVFTQKQLQDPLIIFRDYIIAKYKIFHNILLHGLHQKCSVLWHCPKTRIRVLNYADLNCTPESTLKRKCIHYYYFCFDGNAWWKTEKREKHQK